MPEYPYESATPEQKRIGAWWWCLHHEIHCEPLTGPIDDRVICIKTQKAASERHRRLSELCPVLHPDRLPASLLVTQQAYVTALKAYVTAQQAYATAWQAYDTAWQAYATTRQAYDTAQQAYVTAEQAYVTAREACEAELMELHREEYPDTKWNGRSIFDERS